MRDGIVEGGDLYWGFVDGKYGILIFFLLFKYYMCML